MEENSEAVVDMPSSLKMSRKEKPEFSVDLLKVEDLKVIDEWGRKPRFSDLYKDQKTIIIFIRHFLCFMYKEYVDVINPKHDLFPDLALIPDKYFKEAGVKVVVIGCGPRKFIEPFRRATGYKGLLYVDPTCELFKKIGCLEKGKTDNLANVKESKHVKSGLIMGVLKSTWRGMQYRELQGDVNQQGGAIVLGPGNNISLKHFDQLPSDQIPINDLLAAAGVQQVNFTKDRRVMKI